MTERQDVGVSRLDQLLHSANNCHQMLHAIDRKLAKALRCLEEGDTDECRRLLMELSEALPEAMSIIRHDNDDEFADNSDCG